MIFSKNFNIGQGSSPDCISSAYKKYTNIIELHLQGKVHHQTMNKKDKQKIQTREMFSKQRTNAIERHEQNLEQGKDLTDSEQKIGDQAARKSPADFPIEFSLPCLQFKQVTIKDLSNIINLPTRSSINGQALDGFSTLQR